MAMHKELDIEEVKKAHRYCPTGKILYQNSADVEAGYILPNGYKYAYVGKRLITVQRLVWMLHHGDPGGLDIDHIDGNKLNNKIENLRAVTRSQNNQNRRAAQSNNETSGVMGVHYDKSRRKWAASLNVGGTKVFFQRFNTKQEAIEARAEAVRKHHPFAPTDL